MRHCVSRSALAQRSATDDPKLSTAPGYAVQLKAFENHVAWAPHPGSHPPHLFGRAWREFFTPWLCRQVFERPAWCPAGLQPVGAPWDRESAPLTTGIPRRKTALASEPTQISPIAKPEERPDDNHPASREQGGVAAVIFGGGVPPRCVFNLVRVLESGLCIVD